MNFEKLRNIAVGLAVMVALAFTVSTGPVSAEMKKKEFKVSLHGGSSKTKKMVNISSSIVKIPCTSVVIQIPS